MFDLYYTHLISKTVYQAKKKKLKKRLKKENYTQYYTVHSIYKQ